ncbi:MAG: hypothetical protein VBE63_25970 [Lamprobacter sp.]|uniref:hypothetical protein n=1 Tax=Lamprobacter sp. TaxID=3100796 RepID=UPI002B25B765|nr:hypothetical protein [Lamprobacter sp.]MEA3643355.1 hypothetical protein [Lamprobacter sp.]
MTMINFTFRGLPGRAEILPDETYVTWGGAGFQITAAPPAMRAAIVAAMTPVQDEERERCCSGLSRSSDNGMHLDQTLST